jgi:hypothetical protein
VCVKVGLVACLQLINTNTEAARPCRRMGAPKCHHYRGDPIGVCHEHTKIGQIWHMDRSWWTNPSSAWWSVPTSWLVALATLCMIWSKYAARPLLRTPSAVDACGAACSDRPDPPTLQQRPCSSKALMFWRLAVLSWMIFVQSMEWSNAIRTHIEWPMFLAYTVQQYFLISVYFAVATASSIWHLLLAPDEQHPLAPMKPRRAGDWIGSTLRSAQILLLSVSLPAALLTFLIVVLFLLPADQPTQEFMFIHGDESFLLWNQHTVQLAFLVLELAIGRMCVRVDTCTRLFSAQMVLYGVFVQIGLVTGAISEAPYLFLEIGPFLPFAYVFLAFLMVGLPQLAHAISLAVTCGRSNHGSEDVWGGDEERVVVLLM